MRKIGMGMSKIECWIFADKIDEGGGIIKMGRLEVVDITEKNYWRKHEIVWRVGYGNYAVKRSIEDMSKWDNNNERSERYEGETFRHRIKIRDLDME